VNLIEAMIKIIIAACRTVAFYPTAAKWCAPTMFPPLASLALQARSLRPICYGYGSRWSAGLGGIILILILGASESDGRYCSAQDVFLQDVLRQDVLGQRWHGFGVPRAHIDISIGVRPSQPYGIGVPPGQFFSPWPAIVYPDYRSEYNLRIQQSHQAQLRAFEQGAAELPWLPDPLHQATSAKGITQELVAAATRLDRAIARRGEEGDVWRSYLSTQSLIRIAEQPTAAVDLIAIVQNYDGVVANGNLRWVMRSDGFAETRQWLRAFISAHPSSEGHKP
jgi:hypothetical protein